jgi:hypothetical protein
MYNLDVFLNRYHIFIANNLLNHVLLYFMFQIMREDLNLLVKQNQILLCHIFLIFESNLPFINFLFHDFYLKQLNEWKKMR